MIKFKKRAGSSKPVKNQAENRFNQVNEAARDKRAKPAPVLPKSMNSKDGSKGSE